MRIKVGVMGSAGEAGRGVQAVFDEDPGRLLGRCLEALKGSQGEEG